MVFDFVGVYVLGGMVVYLFFVLMNVIFVFAVGVEWIVFVSFLGKDGCFLLGVLVVVFEFGINEIYKVGGV